MNGCDKSSRKDIINTLFQIYTCNGKAMNEPAIGTQFRGEIEALITQLQDAMADAIRGMD